MEPTRNPTNHTASQHLVPYLGFQGTHTFDDQRHCERCIADAAVRPRCSNSLDTMAWWLGGGRRYDSL